MVFSGYSISFSGIGGKFDRKILYLEGFWAEDFHYDRGGEGYGYVFNIRGNLYHCKGPIGIIYMSFSSGRWGLRCSCISYED